MAFKIKISLLLSVFLLSLALPAFAEFADHTRYTEVTISVRHSNQIKSAVKKKCEQVAEELGETLISGGCTKVAITGYGHNTYTCLCQTLMNADVSNILSEPLFSE